LPVPIVVVGGGRWARTWASVVAAARGSGEGRRDACDRATLARDAAIDDARVDFPNALIIDAELRLHVGAEVFDHDVSLFRQTPEHLEAFGILQIERHRALVAVQILESEPWRGPPGCSPPASSISASILMTLAPQSASCRTQVGPARTRGSDQAR